MRQLPLWICLFLLLPTLAIPQQAKPPGITTADQEANLGLEPPMVTPHKLVDIDEVRYESVQLQKLADEIPGEIQQVTEGKLPKDLNDNLRRIEKLSKHLRSEVTF